MKFNKKLTEILIEMERCKLKCSNSSRIWYEHVDFENISSEFIKEVKSILHTLPEFHRNDIQELMKTFPDNTLQDIEDKRNKSRKELDSEMSKILYILGTKTDISKYRYNTMDGLEEILTCTVSLVEFDDNTKKEIEKILKPKSYYISLFKDDTKYYNIYHEMLEKIVELYNKIELIHKM